MTTIPTAIACGGSPRRTQHRAPAAAAGDAPALRSPSDGFATRRSIHGIWSIAPGAPGCLDLVERLTVGETLRDDCASPDLVSDHPGRSAGDGARTLGISVALARC